MATSTSTPDTKEEPAPPTPEEIAEADEKAANALAVGYISGFVNSDQPLRMVDDAYTGVVGTARRYNAGEGTKEAVQAELDRVFGKGKVSADDITTAPPEVEPPATTKK